MTRILEVVVAVLLVALAYLAFGLFLPSHRHVSHEIESLHSVRQVYDVLNSFRRFPDWHPMRGLDPDIKYSLEGEDRGVGAVLRYESNNRKIGTGTLTIVESDLDERIVYEVDNQAYGTGKRHTIVLESLGRKMKIRWSYDVEYGWDIFGRFAGLYVTRTAGDDIKYGLGNLLSLLSTMPNHDYSGLDIEELVVAPQHVLYVTNNTDRNISAVETATDEALQLLARAIADNRLERAGPPRLITTNWGDTKYEFDIAIPVRLAGTGVDEDSEDAEAAPAELVPLPELRLSNERVKLGTGYTGPAVMANYTGHPAALPLVRDMLRAYAAAHGEYITDRAFEEQLSDMATTQPEDSQYRVYWPVTHGRTPVAPPEPPMQEPAPADEAGEGENGEAAEPAEDAEESASDE